MSEIIKIDENLYSILNNIRKEKEEQKIPFTFSQAIRELADPKKLNKYNKSIADQK